MSKMNNLQRQLSTQKISNGSKRWVEIYVIWNKLNGKCYVGQAFSHMESLGKFVPHGHKQRLKDHIRNANLDQDRQCRAIKNALNEFGPENFDVELLEICTPEEACEYEKFYMEIHNSVKDGYNIQSGSRNVINTLEAKQARSKATRKVAEPDKFVRFRNVKEYKGVFDHIRVSYRDGKVFGWMVYVSEKIKADFAGVHIPLLESYQTALNFFYTLKNNLKKVEEKKSEVITEEFGEDSLQEVQLGMLLTAILYFRQRIKSSKNKRTKAYKNPDPRLVPYYKYFLKRYKIELENWRNNKRNTLMREVPKALATTLFGDD